MKILIVAATSLELDPIQKLLNNSEHELDFLHTGVGMTATAFHLAKKITEIEYDLAINVGLAGAFHRKIALGEVVNVISDQLAEEGAEDGEQFLSIWRMSLRAENEFPFESRKLKAKIPDYLTKKLTFREVEGITVNKVHGNDSSIKELQNRLNPDIESMEGASFLYACLSTELPCIQIRAISNYVERRNRSSWEVESALNNLAKELKALLEKIE